MGNPLNLEESDSVFNFETVSEKDNLGDWITRAETDSVEDKSDRIAKKAGDTEYIKLTVKEDKDKAYNYKEIDDLNDNMFDFLTTLEEEELDKWLIKTDNPLNLEESDSVFNFETVS